MEIFHYAFQSRAFLVGLVLAVIIPCIGVIVVFKRLSLIGDALSHSSLAGVAAGLYIGIDPTLGSVLACILAALGIEALRKKVPQYAELSIAVVLSAGVGLSGVLSGMQKTNGANFNRYLFGSIVAISDFEAGLSVVIGVVVAALFLFFSRELFYVTFDERAARLAGVPVKMVNFIFTILTAVTVSIAARVVGALVVSSMMVIPVVCAMQVAKSYRQTVAWSVGFCMLFTICGLLLSFYAQEDLRPGSTIILMGVGILLLLLLGGAIKNCLQKNRQEKR